MNRALICITTCHRLTEVEKYIWDYIRFINANNAFDFVLALDGQDNDYIQFCEKYGIPLLYSEKREGVGLSKNRVLEKFQEYNYYFFIEDDVELINSAIFSTLIHISQENDIPHLCSNKGHKIIKTEVKKGYELQHSQTGGGYFTFYTIEGLKEVGGWNTFFAKFRRFGHTEHSFRFYHANLQKSPFIFPIEESSKSFLLHDPPSVSNHSSLEVNSHGIFQAEQELIDQKTVFFPIRTISKYYFNGKNMGKLKEAETFLENNPDKFPLTFGKERRYSLAEHYALMIDSEPSFFKKSFLFIRILFLYPNNNAFKHWLKMKFKLKK